MNICSNYGGLGDHIARLPAIKWIKETQPHVRMTVYWHDFFVPLARILVPEGPNLRHFGISEMEWADDQVPLIDFTPDRLNSLALNLVEHGFITIAQRMPPAEYRGYPKYSSEASRAPFLDAVGDFVVVTPCFTSWAREWPVEEINATMAGIKDLGLKVVTLGRTELMPTGNERGIKAQSVPLDETLIDLNLINRGDLILALEVMSRAKAVLGVDNGLLHLSACTETPSVWGFTSVEPKLRFPYNIHAEVISPKGCRFCQSDSYLVKTDFRQCMYQDYACTKEMKSEYFLDGLKKLLAKTPS